MKLYKNIAIVFAVIILLVGGLVLVKNLPQKDKDTDTDVKNPNTEYIDILRLDIDDIVKIQLDSEDATYTVSKSGEKFQLSDSANLKISEKVLNSFVNSCSYIYAEKLADENEDNSSIYGFDSPKATITISLKDGTKKLVYIGNEIVDASGSYIKLADEERIYIKNAYGIFNLMPKYESFIDTDVLTIKPANNEKLSNIKIMKSGNKTIELKSSVIVEDDKKSLLWKMTQPAFADANTLILGDSVLTPLETFKADGVVVAKTADLAKFGLDKPYASIQISADNITQKLVFGDEVEGYRFFMVDNYETVYMVSADKLPFFEVAYIDLMSRLIHLENIKNIKTVEIKSNDGDFTLKISGKEYSINGKKIDESTFKKVYQNIIGIRFDSVDTEAKPNGAKDVTIKYTRNDGSSCVVSFVSVSERNYLALVDNEGSFVVGKKTVHDAINFIKEKLDEVK